MNERLRITSTGSVGVGTASPDASALLDLTSTNRGFAPPRMTTGQRTGISSPVNGLIVYDTTLDQMFIRAAGAWTNLAAGSVGSMSDLVDDTTPQLGGTLDMNGQNITTATGFNIDITGSAAGNDFTVDTNKFVVSGDNGVVGIGLSNPGAGLGTYDNKLHIQGSGAGTAGRTAMTMENTNASSATRLELRNSDGSYGSMQVNGSTYPVPSIVSFGTKDLDIEFSTNGNLASGGTQ